MESIMSGISSLLQILKRDRHSTSVQAEAETQELYYSGQMMFRICDFDNDMRPHDEAMFIVDFQYPIPVCLQCYEEHYRGMFEGSHYDGESGPTLQDLATKEHIEPWRNPDGYQRFFPDYQP